MNLRLFSIAILVSALPLFAFAESASISLNQGDFVSAQRTNQAGESVVKVTLSKSGKAKFKKLNEHSVDKNIHAEIAGVTSDFKLREPIAGDSLQMGPYSSDQADKIVAEINNKK